MTLIDEQNYEDDISDYDEDREDNEMIDIFEKCTCGAYHLTKSGEVIMIADCCCGAG